MTQGFVLLPALILETPRNFDVFCRGVFAAPCSAAAASTVAADRLFAVSLGLDTSVIYGKAALSPAGAGRVLTL